jgi:hypothetical protein
VLRKQLSISLILVALWALPASGETAPTQAEIDALTRRFDKERWTPVFVGDSLVLVVGYDRQRVENLPADRYRAWFRWDSATANTSVTGRRYFFEITKHEVDCRAMRYRSLVRVKYGADANVVESWEAKDPEASVWSEVIPESIGEASYGEFCSDMKGMKAAK